MLSDEEIVDNCISGLPFTLYTKEKGVIADAIRKSISEARSGMFTSEDMKEAFNQGADYSHVPEKYYDFPEWIANYKKEREHGEA